MKTLIDIFKEQTVQSDAREYINATLSSLQPVVKEDKKRYFKAVFIVEGVKQPIIKTVFEETFNNGIVPICPVKVKVALLPRSYINKDTGEEVQTTKVAEITVIQEQMSALNQLKLAGVTVKLN